jgi:hypothetical protein
MSGDKPEVLPAAPPPEFDTEPSVWSTDPAFPERKVLSDPDPALTTRDETDSNANNGKLGTAAAITGPTESFGAKNGKAGTAAASTGPTESFGAKNGKAGTAAAITGPTESFGANNGKAGTAPAITGQTKIVGAKNGKSSQNRAKDGKFVHTQEQNQDERAPASPWPSSDIGARASAANGEFTLVSNRERLSTKQSKGKSQPMLVSTEPPKPCILSPFNSSHWPSLQVSSRAGAPPSASLVTTAVEEASMFEESRATAAAKLAMESQQALMFAESEALFHAKEADKEAWALGVAKAFCNSRKEAAADVRTAALQEEKYQHDLSQATDDSCLSASYHAQAVSACQVPLSTSSSSSSGTLPTPTRVPMLAVNSSAGILAMVALVPDTKPVATPAALVPATEAVATSASLVPATKDVATLSAKRVAKVERSKAKRDELEAPPVEDDGENDKKPGTGSTTAAPGSKDGDDEELTEVMAISFHEQKEHGHQQLDSIARRAFVADHTRFHVQETTVVEEEDKFKKSYKQTLAAKEEGPNPGRKDSDDEELNEVLVHDAMVFQLGFVLNFFAHVWSAVLLPFVLVARACTTTVGFVRAVSSLITTKNAYRWSFALDAWLYSILLSAIIRTWIVLSSTVRKLSRIPVWFLLSCSIVLAHHYSVVDYHDVSEWAIEWVICLSEYFSMEVMCTLCIVSLKFWNIQAGLPPLFYYDILLLGQMYFDINCLTLHPSLSSVDAQPGALLMNCPVNFVLNCYKVYVLLCCPLGFWRSIWNRSVVVENAVRLFTPSSCVHSLLVVPLDWMVTVALGGMFDYQLRRTRGFNYNPPFWNRDHYHRLYSIARDRHHLRRGIAVPDVSSPLCDS